MSSQYQSLASDILQQVKKCWSTWSSFQQEQLQDESKQHWFLSASPSPYARSRQQKRPFQQMSKDVVITTSASDSESSKPWLSSNKNQLMAVMPADVMAPSPKKQKRLEVFQVGDRVRKHYPGSGWYNGKVVAIRSKTPLSSTIIYTVRYDDGDEEELYKEHLADVVSGRDKGDKSVYSLEEFAHFWECLAPEQVEKSSVIRRANSALGPQDVGPKDASELVQQTAQYGRIMPGATDRIFQILQLKKGDCYLDIGHGIGNTCFQAAYTIGCQARGIEVVRDRYNESRKFHERLERLALYQDAADGMTRSPGTVVLKHGDLTDPLHHNWLVKANKVFINNFGGVFAERSERTRGTSWLDHYVTGLFASMEEGAMILSLHDLQMGPGRTQVNKWREGNGLEKSPNASFFEVSKIELGEAGEIFSWSTSCKTPAYAYLYRRIQQDANLRGGVILCCNKACDKAIQGVPISATALNQEGRVVMGACECKCTVRSRRHLPHMKFDDYMDSHPVDGR